MCNYVRCTFLCLLCFCLIIKLLADYQPSDKVIIATPRVKFVPETEANFIYFKYSDPTSTRQHIDSINSFLSGYFDPANQVETLRNCDFNNTRTENDVCIFDINSLGRCSHMKDFGFSSGGPCIFFTLGQAKHWVPVVLKKRDVKRHSIPIFNVPDYLNSSLTPNKTVLEKYVWLTCDGESPEDKEFIGPISYYPQNGFPTYYFPFTRIKGYQSPIVAVHFERPQRGVAITIECRVWAENIPFDRKKGSGFVKFLLLID